MVAGYVTVQTGVHSQLVFSVQGTQTLNYAREFAAASAKATSFVTLNETTPSAVSHLLAGASNAGTLFEVSSSGVQGGTVTVPAGGGLVFDNVSGPETIQGSGSGDTVLVFAGNAQSTYVDNGGNNQIIFVDGNNTYDGGSGNDRIVTGAGSDTVNTGTGDATVNSGGSVLPNGTVTGQSLIFLNDTAASSTFNDYAWLDDGQNTVWANGTNDAVISNTDKQLIWSTGNGSLAVVLNDGPLSGLNPTSNTSDTVNILGGAGTAVYDFTSNNAVFGGSGILTFISGVSITAAISGASGGNTVFGAAGDSIDFYTSAADTGSNQVIVGSGNETLYGGNSAGNQIFWGFADTTGATTDANSSIVGGSGNDTFVSGIGNETIGSGSGSNLFFINADTAYTGPTSILLQDFGNSNSNLVNFSGYSQTQVQNALDSAMTLTVNGTPEVVLSLNNGPNTDSTTVTFVGVSSLSGKIV